MQVPELVHIRLRRNWSLLCEVCPPLLVPAGRCREPFLASRYACLCWATGPSIDMQSVVALPVRLRLNWMHLLWPKGLPLQVHVEKCGGLGLGLEDSRLGLEMWQA